MKSIAPHAPYCLDEIRHKISLVTLVGNEIELKRRLDHRYWGLCPFHKEKTPSFCVNEKKGFAFCFGCEWYGDIFDWVRARQRLSFKDAVKFLADYTGSGAVIRKPTAPKEHDTLDQDNDNREIWAQRLWFGCRPAARTLVEIYLKKRRIDPLPSGVIENLRYHPALYHKESDTNLPAMVAALQNSKGHITGIHRTFLKRNGLGKAQIPHPKKMAGKARGSAIRLQAAEETLCIAEGIETALSIMVATGLPAWAAGSLGNMALIEVPPIVKDVVLCVDADGNQAALDEIINKAADFYATCGKRVRIAYPKKGMDFNDMLRRAMYA